MIQVKQLRKNYGAHEALKGISFDIRQGECYGLLGPNGAGKTTTISIMSSILKPDSGEVLINDRNIYTHAGESKRIIGVVPQEIALYNELTANENLMFWGGLYHVPKQELKSRVDEILKMVGLSDRKNERISAYSGGMKRRINIAAALLHRPKVLFMDEPTVGIDPQSRNLIFEVIEQLHRQGMTIVYTTHYMEEAERLCDRIGIIDSGQIIAQGTIDELKSGSSVKESIVVTFDRIDDSMMNKLKAFRSDSVPQGDSISFLTSDLSKDLPHIVAKCNETGAEIRNIGFNRQNLEAVFLSLTGKQLRD